MKHHPPQDVTAAVEKLRRSETTTNSLSLDRPRQTGGLTRAIVTHSKPTSRRLHRKQAAEHLGVSLSWLDKARGSGFGPVFISIGGRVVYDSGDLEEFLQKNRHQSTSE